MYLTQGTELNSRYVIESLLGHGGFGITYAAHDKTLNVRVAVKEYLPRQLATRGEGQTKVSVYSGEARQHYDYGLGKFMEEAQSVARFAHHPNVVSARDYFTANGTAYMVMEYVEGVTLKEYLEKKGGRISFEEAKGIMMPVMDALREVHQAGMLHRDVSPDNIYITTSAQVKILDFGAARYFAGEQSKSLSVILKPGYAPEEQYRSSGKQGSWTDVYAVGATIYKALTGKTPPDALDRKEEDTLEPPSRLGVSIPPPAEQALLQALAVNAGQRFQNMGEFQQALLGDAPMTMAFQPGPASFQPTPQPSYNPISGPGSAPPPISGQPAAPPSHQPSHYPQLPRRSANPAAIAAGIGAGVLGLVLVVGLIWYLVGRETPETKLLKQGMQYVQAQNYPQAQAALEEARRLAPNDARIHLQLAKTYHGLKRSSEELKAYQEVIRCDPANVEAHFHVGMNYVRQGKKDLAQQEYLQIKEKKPVEFGKQLFAAIYPPTEPKVKKARELLAKGRDYYEAQNYVQAEAALKESVDLDPQEAGAYSYLGLTYAGLNRLPEAIGAYRQAINLKSDFPEAYLNLGVAYDKSEKSEDAIEAWKAAVRFKPDYWLAHYNLAAIYWRRGQKELALEHYKLLQVKDPPQARSLKEQVPDLDRYAALQTGFIASSDKSEKILNFKSLIVVHPDAFLTVTEDITVQATNQEIKRGIVRDVPTTYRDSQGNSVKVNFKLEEVRRDHRAEPYHTETVANGIKIFIGQKDVLLQPGVYTYTIKYRVDRGISFFKDFDELYWNVTGNGWTFAIDRAEAIIELPPKAKILNSAAYTGFQGDRGRDFTIQAGESNIVFKATRALAPREGLTVAVSWPKGLGYELSGDSVEVAKEVLARGREYYQATDYARAREALEQVVKLNPQDAEAHYLLGLTYASLNKPQPKEALGELRRAVELKPEVYSWRAIGSKLAELKRHKEAAEAFKKALEADANDAEARYQLGEAYLKSGEKTKAKEEQKILQGQNDELAQKLLAAIKKQEMPAGGGGGQRQLERQLDEDAMRIRIKRGEIPSAGAAPRRTPPPAQAATPRATPPPAQAATPKATSPPTPPAGVGWKIERRGEVRIK